MPEPSAKGKTMENNGTVTRVASIPNCDVDASHGPAYADAKLSIGPWGYVCKPCFDYYDCSLGLGRGQELKLREPEKPKHEQATVGDMLDVVKPKRTVCSGGQEAHDEHIHLNGECPWEHGNA